MQDPCLQRTASVAPPQRSVEQFVTNAQTPRTHPAPSPIDSKSALSQHAKGPGLRSASTRCAKAIPEAALPRHDLPKPKRQAKLAQNPCICEKILRTACMHDPESNNVQLMSDPTFGAAAHRVLSTPYNGCSTHKPALLRSHSAVFSITWG